MIYTGNLFYHPKGGEEGGLESINKRLGQLTSFRSRHNVPVFVQQVGVRGRDDDGSKSATKGVLNMLVDNRVGFTYWEYRGSVHEEEYGVLFREGKNGWKTDTGAMNAISGAFKR